MSAVLDLWALKWGVENGKGISLASNFCLPFTISVFSLMICYSLIVPTRSWNTGRTVESHWLLIMFPSYSWKRDSSAGISTGLFKMIVWVLTTCRTQYAWNRNTCILFNRKTLKIFVTYFIGALYVHPLWFYKHQHYNRVRSKMFVACQHTIL
jgi:hypothetical protein